MLKSLKFRPRNSAEDRRQSITSDIVCSVLRAHMTLMQGYKLLCYDRTVKNGERQKAFFYSDPTPYTQFVKKLYTQFVHEPGTRMSMLIKNRYGIIVSQPSLELDGILVINGFTPFEAAMNQFDSTHLMFETCPSAQHYNEPLLIGTSDATFEDTVFKVAGE